MHINESFYLFIYFYVELGAIVNSTFNLRKKITKSINNIYSKKVFSNLKKNTSMFLKTNEVGKFS